MDDDPDVVVTDADMEDPELLAELYALTGGPPPAKPKPPADLAAQRANLQDRIAAKKKEAIALKGDKAACVAAIQEYKAMEAELAKLPLPQQPVAPPPANAKGPPTDADIDSVDVTEEDMNDPILLAELAGLGPPSAALEELTTHRSAAAVPTRINSGDAPKSEAVKDAPTSHRGQHGESAMEEPRPAKLSDDELLARYPEEASMIVVCGVPREEILAGLRSRASFEPDDSSISSIATEPAHRSQQVPTAAIRSTRRPSDEGDDLARLMDVMSVDGAKPTAGAAPKPPSQPSAVPSADSDETNEEMNALLAAMSTGAPTRSRAPKTGVQDDAAFSRLVASMDAKASTPPARDAAHLHANLDPEMEQLVACMTTPSGMTTPAEAAADSCTGDDELEKLKASMDVDDPPPPPTPATAAAAVVSDRAAATAAAADLPAKVAVAAAAASQKQAEEAAAAAAASADLPARVAALRAEAAQLVRLSKESGDDTLKAQAAAKLRESKLLQAQIDQQGAGAGAGAVVGAGSSTVAAARRGAELSTPPGTGAELSTPTGTGAELSTPPGTGAELSTPPGTYISPSAPVPEHARMLAHGTLHLFLSHARDLKSMDSNGFSDPYVKFSLAGKEVKSKVIDKNLNPRWSEVFKFTGVLKDLIAEPLSLRCKDKDTLTSDKLGEASVDLGGLARTRMVELQAQLSTQGTVYLRAFWQADGDSTPPADFTADVPAIIAAAAAAADLPARVAALRSEAAQLVRLSKETGDDTLKAQAAAKLRESKLLQAQIDQQGAGAGAGSSTVAAAPTAPRAAPIAAPRAAPAAAPAAGAAAGSAAVPYPHLRADELELTLMSAAIEDRSAREMYCRFDWAENQIGANPTTVKTALVKGAGSYEWKATFKFKLRSGLSQKHFERSGGQLELVALSKSGWGPWAEEVETKVAVGDFRLKPPKGDNQLLSTALWKRGVTLTRPGDVAEFGSFAIQMKLRQPFTEGGDVASAAPNPRSAAPTVAGAGAAAAAALGGAGTNSAAPAKQVVHGVAPKAASAAPAPPKVAAAAAPAPPKAAAAAPASLEEEHEDPMAYANRLVSIEVVNHEIERLKKAVGVNPRYVEVVEALVFRKEMIEMNVQCGMLTLPQYLDGLREAIAADKIRYKDKGDKVAGTHFVIMTKELKEAEENL